MKKPSKVPTTEDLEAALQVLSVFVGDKETYPYDAPLAEPAKKVYDGITRILAFRKR